MIDAIKAGLAENMIRGGDDVLEQFPEVNFEALRGKSNDMQKHAFRQAMDPKKRAVARNGIYEILENVAGTLNMSLPTDFELDDDDVDEFIMAAIFDNLEGSMKSKAEESTG